MKTGLKQGSKFSEIQNFLLFALRLAIGWHFLYEGVSKFLIPNWTASGYLTSSRWIFSGFFHWIAANATVLQIVDYINMWGLTLVGLALVLGLFTRIAAFTGIGFLLLYYVANPPFIGTSYGLPLEGHYLFVDKNLVEMVALSVIAFFNAGRYMGLDRFRLYFKQRGDIDTLQHKMESKPATRVKPEILNMDRRQILKNLVSVPILGGFALGTIRKYNWEKVNAITGATIQVSDSKLKDLQGELPKGKIGNQEISRLIMGGNLIGGWSHSRDLVYVSSLFKAYNTEKKIFETLELGEMAGINAINITGSQFPIINKYKSITGSKLKVICQVDPRPDDIYGEVNHAIDNDVALVQIKGSTCDWRVQEGRIDVLAECIDYTRQQGYTVGLGAHAIQGLVACDQAGLKPDFYMKTLHHDQYWSAHPREKRVPFSVDAGKSINHDEFCDNIFCMFPEETVQFINSREVPVIGFKVLAGGALKPEDGFRFAFENGADFICVGMFDFQVVDDVNTTLSVLNDLPNRQRGWYA